MSKSMKKLESRLFSKSVISMMLIMILAMAALCYSLFQINVKGLSNDFYVRICIGSFLVVAITPILILNRIYFGNWDKKVKKKRRVKYSITDAPVQNEDDISSFKVETSIENNMGEYLKSLKERKLDDTLVSKISDNQLITFEEEREINKLRKRLESDSYVEQPKLVRPKHIEVNLRKKRKRW